MLAARLFSLGMATILAVSLAACASGTGAPSTPQPRQEVLPFQSTPPAGDSMSNDSSMDRAMSSDASMNPSSMAEPARAPEAVMESETSKDRYVDYSPEAFARAAQSGRAVLFFKASWCPTCNAADRDFRASLDRIPADVTMLKVDYDEATDLKARYTVTYQHTFIQVDAQGNQVSRWNGGGLRDLIANLK